MGSYAQFLNSKLSGIGAGIGHVRRGLFQRGIDRGELGVELGAEPVHDGDDGERNASSDQAILDGGRAGLVSQKCSERSHAGLQAIEGIKPAII
jgi:hypothetical protein